MCKIINVAPLDSQLELYHINERLDCIYDIKDKTFYNILGDAEHAMLRLDKATGSYQKMLKLRLIVIRSILRKTYVGFIKKHNILDCHNIPKRFEITGQKIALIEEIKVLKFLKKQLSSDADEIKLSRARIAVSFRRILNLMKDAIKEAE